jgi:A/G-specific adenine glycosylase
MAATLFAANNLSIVIVFLLGVIGGYWRYPSFWLCILIGQSATQAFSPVVARGSIASTTAGIDSSVSVPFNSIAGPTAVTSIYKRQAPTLKDSLSNTGTSVASSHTMKRKSTQSKRRKKKCDDTDDEYSDGDHEMDVGNKNGDHATTNDEELATRFPLVYHWLMHTDASYHDFDPHVAMEIQHTLVTWYRQYRRKLPWRGDPPPWDGSTADSATRLHPEYQPKKETGKQRKISAYFSSKETAVTSQTSSLKSKKRNNQPSPSVTDVSLSNNASLAAFPVTPYGVWVSEIMLQQTRVEAVIPYWIQWMQAFPTVHDLARADPNQVQALWAGLGYYRRARFLHQAAQQLVQDSPQSSDIAFPTNATEWMALPGVGRYTASAIASIALQERVPVVDGNVCRVLSRLTSIAQHVQAPALKDAGGWDLAAQLVQAPVASDTNDTMKPKRKMRSAKSIDTSDEGSNDTIHAGDINQALMELGATYCAPHGSGIDPHDPLKDYYQSTQLGRQLAQIMTDSPRLWEQLLEKARCSVVESKCALCAPQGRLEALLSFQEAMEDLQSSSGKPPLLEPTDVRGARCGHKMLPLSKPPTVKREEVLAIAVVSRTRPLGKGSVGKLENTVEYLWVRRPRHGLLAGQWEFPTVCLWSSATPTATTNKKKAKSDDASESSEEPSPRKSKRQSPASAASTTATAKKSKKAVVDVPQIPVKQQLAEVQQLWAELTHSNVTGCPLTPSQATLQWSPVSSETPLEHVFSHVRHTMWVHCAMLRDEDGTRNSDLPSSWKTADGREIQWASETAMAQLGLTAGVKKVLQAVRKQHETTSSSNGKTATVNKSAGTKRRRKL